MRILHSPNSSRASPARQRSCFCGDQGKAVSAISVAFNLFLSKQTDVLAILGLGGSCGTALITPVILPSQFASNINAHHTGREPTNGNLDC
ncbi:Tm-1-like ATP-binding domain-containing protein [Photorhabdus sp. S10-54]|uniref:Tm-1-like ATP-binding domain-containing protein n=1 Tax=unclassified Photorhabdus TaxID=2620880 RepID=UPI00403F83F2